MTEQQKQNIIEVVRDYGKRLFYFIRKRVESDDEAEDILQDVWFRFNKVISVSPVEQVGAWLFRVAKNRIIDKYRRYQPDSLDELFDDEQETGMAFREMVAAVDTSSEIQDLRTAFWRQLLSALNELPKEQQQVFIWNELEDISFKEIAERTGENLNTLISRKRYAVLHLRKRLEQLYKEITEQ